MKNIQNLRVVFVQMLFALAIGQVALKAGDLVNHDISLYKSISNYYYIYTHLLLCVVILSTSWVGWQISQSTGNIERINSIFSWPYLILLLDIFLVISYFIIVRGAEINTNHEVISASAYNETFWSMMIFITYLLWDVITKIRDIEFEKIEDGIYRRKLKFSFGKMSSRSWQTLVCLLISIFVFFTMSSSTRPVQVAISDIILICLFFLFRSLKQEIKQSYKLQEEQIPESLKERYSFANYPLIVVDKDINSKVFIVKWLPGLLVLIFIFVYYTI